MEILYQLTVIALKTKLTFRIKKNNNNYNVNPLHFLFFIIIYEIRLIFCSDGNIEKF